MAVKGTIEVIQDCYGGHWWEIRVGCSFLVKAHHWVSTHNFALASARKQAKRLGIDVTGQEAK